MTMTMALNKNDDDDDDDDGEDDHAYDDIVIPDNSLRHDPLEFFLKTCYTQNYEPFTVGGDSLDSCVIH